jgi:hypothetical protein
MPRCRQGNRSLGCIRAKDEMMSVDGFIAKSDGIDALFSKITEFDKSIRQVPLADLCVSLWQRKCYFEMTER